MARLSFFGWPETGLLSGGDTGPISRGHLRPQSFNNEPEAGRQFEEPEAGIEPPQVHVLGEVRGDNKGKSTPRGPRGDDHAEDGKPAWDVTRLEKHTALSATSDFALRTMIGSLGATWRIWQLMERRVWNS